jgi:hypothetical protein
MILLFKLGNYKVLSFGQQSTSGFITIVEENQLTKFPSPQQDFMVVKAFLNQTLAEQRDCLEGTSCFAVIYASNSIKSSETVTYDIYKTR